MAVEQVARFNFSLAELAPAEVPQLHLLDADSISLPSGGQIVPATARPRWMPRLLPVFAAGDPLCLQVLASGSAAFAARLVASLAAIFASSGQDAGIRVAAWESSLAVGAHDLERLPAQAHAVVAVAELEAGSIRDASEALRSVPAARAWLVLNGDLRSLDRVLGIDSVEGRLPSGRLVRLPLLGSRDLAALSRGVQPGMARPESGRRYLELAVALLRAYLERPA